MSGLVLVVLSLFGQLPPGVTLPPISTAELADGVSKTDLRDWYLDRFKERQPLRKPLLRVGSEMRDDDVGILPYTADPTTRTPFIKTKVLQILSDDSELLSVEMYGWVHRRGPPVARWEPDLERSVVVMAKGVSTRGLADGDRVQLPGWWIVSGSEAYESRAGKRTVRVISPFPAPRELEAEIAEKEKSR